MAPAITVRTGPARLCAVRIAGLSFLLYRSSQVNAFSGIYFDSTDGLKLAVNAAVAIGYRVSG
jgi:hypothetical protein